MRKKIVIDGNLKRKTSFMYIANGNHIKFRRANQSKFLKNFMLDSQRYHINRVDIINLESPLPVFLVHKCTSPSINIEPKIKLINLG